MTLIDNAPPPQSEPPSSPPQSNASKPQTEDENWGYDLYPERKGSKYSPSWTSRLLGFEGREQIDKIRCERNVYSCLMDSKLKIMRKSL